MNEIKIYLNPSGSTAELYKDFSLYQYCYQYNVKLTKFIKVSATFRNTKNCLKSRQITVTTDKGQT